MPITFCHPAAAVPLKKYGLVLSALVIGSMMPDFEFFLRLSDGKAIGHTFPGIFLFDIPIGLIVMLIYHKLIKCPLLSLMPNQIQAKLIPYVFKFSFFPVSRLINILFSLAIGTGTHFLLDSFTHIDGFFVQKIPVLSTPVLYFTNFNICVYHLLQYFGSAICAWLLILWALRWYKNNNVHSNLMVVRKVSSQTRKQIIVAFTCFPVVMGLLYGYFSSTGFENYLMLKRFISHGAIAIMAGFMFSLVVFGITWHFKVPQGKRMVILPSDKSIQTITPELGPLVLNEEK